MPVQLGDLGQPGFDQPIALMMDCHRRIESFLGVLEHVAAQSAGQPLDDRAAAAVRSALRYFNTGALNHTADEELSLFPRLQALDRDDLTPILEGAAHLEAQHRRAEVIHERIRDRFQRWLDHGRIPPDDHAALTRDLDALRALYSEHIAFEDKVLFPAAQAALDHDAITRIGREMAQRRGLTDINQRLWTGEPEGAATP